MKSDNQAYRHVLAAVDGSESAEKALKKAVEITKRNHSELVIAHAVDTHVYSMGEPALYLSDTEFNFDQLETKLEEYKAQAELAGIENVKIILSKGNPKTVLSEELPRKFNTDLIVVGQSGLNAVERWMVGSVSEHIIRSAPCDVLMVKNEEENEN